MKHQITFVGGQVLPVFVGIKECPPDIIHFIISNESRAKVNLLKPLLNTKRFSENVCNPFAFTSIRQACEKILGTLTSEDQVEFNLTGGTKIMVLAAQSLIHENGLTGFYINQDNTLLHIPSYKTERVNTEISIKEFLEISGHKLGGSKTLTDFSSDDLSTAEAINDFAIKRDRLFYNLMGKIRSNYNGVKNIPANGKIELNKSTKLMWSGTEVKIEENGSGIFMIQSPNVKGLFFNSSWWELLVAREISKWTKAKELLIQCELPFKTNTAVTKNEIDVLINLGGKLIFVECKSGAVKQEDINKMRIIKDTYGGVISKSILVSKFLPNTTIIEKCKELGIDVFSCYGARGNIINPLYKITSALEKLEKKLNI